MISIALEECGPEEGRTGRFRVLPGPSGAPEKVFLDDGGSAKPLMSCERREAGDGEPDSDARRTCAKHQCDRLTRLAARRGREESVVADATVARYRLDARAGRTCGGRIIADPEEAQINTQALTSGLSLRHRIEGLAIVS